LPVISYGQNVYNIEKYYDTPGGLFDIDSLRTIDIWFYDSNYDSILHQSWMDKTKIRLPASISVCSGIVYDSVAVRYKGNSTYAVAYDLGNPKVPLNLDINDIISGQDVFGYKKIKLANSLFDPTFCKELVGYHIFNQYAPSSQANLMKVNLQGNYLGLYLNTESVDNTFLTKHFGEKNGSFFKCDPIQQFGEQTEAYLSDLVWLGNDTTLYYNSYEIKSDYGWTELMRLIYLINIAPEHVDSLLNVDRVLWNFAVNTVMLNLDAYNGMFQHNYYLYQTGDGLFQMIPWDLSETFIGTMLGFSSNTNDFYHYDPYGGFSAGYKPLLDNLMTIPLYKKIYTAHIRTLLKNTLIEEDIKNLVTHIQAIGHDAAETDENKLFSIDDYYWNVDYEYNIPGVYVAGGIMPSVIKRRDYLLSHPEIMKVPPEIINVELFESNNIKYVSVEANNANIVKLRFSVNEYKSKFKDVIMYNDGTNGDIIAGDNIFTVALPMQNSGNTVNYYILAENDEAVSLSPEKAEYEFYVYCPPHADGLFINEFMASNYSTIWYGDYVFADWIEIYNASSDTVDLAGYYLSDNASNLTKHKINIGSDLTKIPPKSFKLFWADGDTDLGALHLSFSLSKSGEFISLTAPDGITVLDSLSFDEQETDISFGRKTDGNLPWMFFINPTPNASNGSNSIDNYTININDIHIFPNPATSIVNLSKSANVKLYNSAGILVYQNNNVNSIDISHLTKGLYFISLSNDNTFTTKKLIIK